MSTAAKYVKNHAAAITSFVVSTAVFAGCEAATVGVGTIGCAALSGAAGSLVTQGFRCADAGGSACSAESFGEAALEGGVEGALGGALGALGGKLLGAVAPKALSAVGGLFGRGVTESADAGLDEAAGVLERDAAEDAGSSVDRGGEKPSAGSEEESAGCPATHSFTGQTRVLMADGTSKPISQVKAGDRIADAVPGQKGTEVRNCMLRQMQCSTYKTSRDGK